MDRSDKKINIFALMTILLALTILACGGSDTVTPTSISQVNSAEPASTEPERPTDVPEQTDTPQPTSTTAPTNTPRPSNTPRPTNTARLSNTPSPEPTNTTAATQPPATSAPAPTQALPTNTPAPTQPVATNTAVPTAAPPTNTIAPTQPPPTPTTVVVPGDVQITFIFYDGQEPQVEGDEYAVIQNAGGQAVNLQGWRLNAGADGQNFNFPGYSLDPGQSCRVYTNRIFPEYCGFSFNSGQALWNNGGDCGYLFDNTGAQVSSYCY